jgi:uncharacterized protein YcfJ
MPKNNTLAVALAALLVGGVATAGYINSRSNDAITAPGVSAGTRAQVDFAEVTAVKPVTQREPMYATVIGSEPIRESSTISTPREVCNDVVVQERLPEHDGNVGGTVAGAVIGGLVGNQVGGGNGRKLATVAGAVAGGYAGREIDRRHVGGQVVNRTDRRCRTVNSTSTNARTVAWNVTYRNPDGTTGSMRSDSKPGERIAVGDIEKTVGYDVTYRWDGQQRTVRMDQDPGAKLPVIDGRVATQTAAVEGATLR